MSKILDNDATLSFPLKSSIATVATLTVVFGGYFTLLALNLSDQAVVEFAYKPLMIATIVPLALLMAVTHGALAALAPRDAGERDERDRQIDWRAAHLGGYVLAVGVFGVLVLALLEAESFYVANALLLAWVLAELARQIARIVLYSRMS